MVQIHKLSKLKSCIRFRIDQEVRSTILKWKESTHSFSKSPSKRLVVPLANMMSEWMRMRCIAMKQVAEALLLEEKLKAVSDRLLALKKVENANLEWEASCREKRSKQLKQLDS